MHPYGGRCKPVGLGVKLLQPYKEGEILWSEVVLWQAGASAEVDVMFWEQLQAHGTAAAPLGQVRSYKGRRKLRGQL